MNIKTWVNEIAEMFGYRIRDEQLRIYAEEINSMRLTPAELEIIARQVRREFDKFPSLAQLWVIGNSIRRTKNATEPVWHTWRDKEGRCYAEKVPGRRALSPSDEDLERWKKEACSPEEGKKAFAKAFLEAGGKPELLAKMQGLVASREAVEEKRIEDEMGVKDFDWGEWPK